MRWLFHRQVSSYSAFTRLSLFRNPSWRYFCNFRFREREYTRKKLCHSRRRRSRRKRRRRRRRRRGRSRRRRREMEEYRWQMKCRHDKWSRDYGRQVKTNGASQETRRRRRLITATRFSVGILGEILGNPRRQRRASTVTNVTPNDFFPRTSDVTSNVTLSEYGFEWAFTHSSFISFLA